MNFGLTERAQELIRSVFRRHPAVLEAKVFGSRAAGTFAAHSDIDLAVCGNISSHELAAIAGELDDLPLPYKFDLQAYEAINYQPLREHIDRVGKPFYSRMTATPSLQMQPQN